MREIKGNILKINFVIKNVVGGDRKAHTATTGKINNNKKIFN